jgi:hypothetical protein
MDKQYHIQWPTPTSNQVNAWTMQYIPFEPKDWRRDMREELKRAIGQIVPDGSGLYATYISENNQFCDVENVLLYNIGAPAFTKLSENSLCFERGFGPVPSPAVEGLVMPHYYHYSQGDTFRLWKPKEVLASWQEIMLPSLCSTSKPHSFWYALKTQAVDCYPQNLSPKRFGLRIQLNAPQTAWCNLYVIVKPLLDGVISAFHRQIIPCDKMMLQRLSDLTGATEIETERLLCETACPVLGVRPIVSSYRQGIKWNPEDDACVACQIAAQRSHQYKAWSMSGQLFSILPMTHSTNQIYFPSKNSRNSQSDQR